MSISEPISAMRCDVPGCNTEITVTPNALPRGWGKLLRGGINREVHLCPAHAEQTGLKPVPPPIKAIYDY